MSAHPEADPHAPADPDPAALDLPPGVPTYRGDDPARPPRRSAGIVLYRLISGHPQVLLGHMGGPFWRRRDAGAWTIPKGGYTPEEDAYAAALREYEEEVGHPAPAGEALPLGEVVQANGKIVTAWALAGDLDPAQARSNTFEVEWPPGSGRRQPFPELDRVAWFTLEDARTRVVTAQQDFLVRLGALLADRRAPHQLGS